MDRPKPIVQHRKIVKQGGSFTITIPQEWFEAHGIDPNNTDKLLLVANSDIRIVNPKHEKEVYDEVSKLVKRGEYEEK